jgi:hypothetical protein
MYILLTFVIPDKVNDCLGNRMLPVIELLHVCSILHRFERFAELVIMKMSIYT